MKKLFTLLALTISFSMNAQVSTNNVSTTGIYASAMGNGTTASGNESTAMGYDTTASAEASTAMGYSTTASGNTSTAMGRSTTASGNYSTAMGQGTTASGNQSTAMGWSTTASGARSTAMGRETTASDYASLVIGQYNSSGSSVTNNATSFSTSNTAFVIGNGTASNAKSDAFKVMFNGNTTIGGDDLTIGDLSAFSGSFTQRSAIDVVAHSDGDLLTGYASGSSGDRFNIELDASNSLAKISSGGGYNLTLSSEGGTITASNDLTVSGDVNISSDARLKSNIVSLGSTLPKLLQIDGKSYEVKGKQKIGVLAQEIQEVFPELVSEDDNEMLAVNYQGLVPVLINALKEQQGEINRLKDQEKRLERLEKLVAKLD